MGSDVSLDRHQDPHSRFLLHAGYFPAEVHPQTSSGGLAGAVHGPIAGGTPTDPAVCSPLSTPRRKGATAGCRCAIQTNSPSTTTGQDARLGRTGKIPQTVGKTNLRAQSSGPSTLTHWRALFSVNSR